jgi:hypothetical protein
MLMDENTINSCIVIFDALVRLMRVRGLKYLMPKIIYWRKKSFAGAEVFPLINFIVMIESRLRINSMAKLWSSIGLPYGKQVVQTCVA